ncbi:hypothetical protein DY000_02042429 [Brassica cretica]|uniref:No apical meristem-associated C-terminal domain-containing protein n=1 Tax=Brassica cretica TaxID=69181 RepID=A0ABQ7BCL1_BRACR|nr:hypothetical protein DY000_02042429 [Brassica cretica]
MGMFVYLSCDLRLIVDRGLLFVLLVYNMLYAIGRMSQLVSTTTIATTTKEKSSGCNENDVLKRAHEIFYNNHKNKFTLEHAWKELRNDQKWCDPYSAKNDGGSKKKKCDDGADSPSSQATEAKCPAGVKAAKAVVVVLCFQGFLFVSGGSVLSCSR